MRFVDPGVVTRAVPVLEICADVLRDVTVLPPAEPWSLGYELTGRRLPRFDQSHSCRSQWRARRSRHAAFLTISAIASRFVHKFVHKPAGRVDCHIPGELMPAVGRARKGSEPPTF